MSLDLAQWQRETAATVLSDAACDAGMAVHRNSVRGGLAETLAAAFPVTLRIVGARAFAILADGFVRGTPPRAPQLSAYGVGFADFVATDALGQRLAYLGDIARLEWARGESYFAADAPAFDPARLALLSPVEMAGAALHLHPATRLVESRFPIHRIWDVNQTDDVPAVNMRIAETVLVTRPGMRIVAHKIAPADAALVKALAAGRSLGEAADTAISVDANFNLQTALAAHFGDATFRI